MRAFSGVVEELEDRRDFRTITLAAEGKQFCVGGDIEEFIAAEDFAAHLRQTLPPAQDLFARFAALPVPILSAIQGAVAGGGLGLALSADIVIASENAFFRAGYPAIGVSPDLGSSWHLLRRTGPTFAAAFFMTNRIVSARGACDAGLVSEVTAPTQLLVRAEEIARALAQMPRASLAAIKRLVSGPAADLPSQMAQEAIEIFACAATSDAAEGLSAFAARRPAVFGET